MGGVAINPGPGPDPDPGAPFIGNKPNLKVKTYNCNGLGNVNKFWRVLTKARDQVKKPWSSG